MLIIGFHLTDGSFIVVFNIREEDPNPNKSGPISAYQPVNGVSLAGRRWPNIECWLGSFVIFQRIWIRIVKKPYSYVI